LKNLLSHTGKLLVFDKIKDNPCALFSCVLLSESSGNPVCGEAEKGGLDFTLMFVAQLLVVTVGRRHTVG